MRYFLTSENNGYTVLEWGEKTNSISHINYPNKNQGSIIFMLTRWPQVSKGLAN